MGEQEKELRLTGIVHASRYDPGVQGKQFLGTTLECSDGKWVIDYDEQSPFHAFAGRQVVVFGEPHDPRGQKLILSRGMLGHFRVSTMRLVEVTPDAELVEVGVHEHLTGRFERSASDTREPTLSFVTEEGDAFVVANDPAGVTVGRSVEVCAWPVQSPASISRSSEQYLWVICPYSELDIREWRSRR